MRRSAAIALLVSALVGLAIVIGGLIPREFGQGPIRRDGPYLHAAAFALLVLPLATVWPRRWPAIVLAAIVFGAALETLQPYFDRAPERIDLIANSVGAFAGGLLGLGLSRRGLGRR
ncbi:MAG: hypothetical protein QNJ13_08665 [Paracoccaceae bacterium]|nr:hypothetical protein [Paracoccaceae bacterium]